MRTEVFGFVVAALRPLDCGLTASQGFRHAEVMGSKRRAYDGMSCAPTLAMQLGTALR